MSHKQKIRMGNNRPEPLVLRIEPWGDELSIQPGKSIDLLFEGPPGGTIEFETEPSAVVIYGWVGSTFEIEGLQGRHWH